MILKDIFNLDLVFIILAVLLPIVWAEDRRRRQVLQVIKQIHASGQVIPADVWERLLQRGGSGAPGSAWTMPIVLISAAAGLLFAAIPLPMEWREAKLFLAVALACVVAAGGLSLAARSRAKNRPE
jgi:hypothetical protein